MSCVAKRFWWLESARLLVLSGWLAALAPFPAIALQTAVLTWTPTSDVSVAGYRIYYGSSSRTYSNFVDAGNVTNASISGLADGSTIYFAATTYDSAGDESTLSDEIVVVTKSSDLTIVNPPVIVSNPPPAVTDSQPALKVVANLAATTNALDPHSLTVSWDADTNAIVAGYRVYWGTTSGVLTKTYHVGLVTSLVLTGLVENTTNYFVIRERDGAWNEGPASSESACYLPAVPKVDNFPPTLNPLTNLTINMNAGLQSIALTGISTGSATERQTVKVSAISNNPKVVALQAIDYVNPNGFGTLLVKPLNGATGTATISVSVKDSGTNNNSITRSFTVTVVNPNLAANMPKITRQLTNAVTLSGRTLALGVGVSGKAPFKYQWKRDGTNITGATGATLTLKGIKANQSGRYSVLVSNSAGVTNSLPALVTVVTNPAPTIAMPFQANGQFAVQIDGVTGAKYVVQGSSDLKNWSSLVTNTAPFTFTESGTDRYKQRFYRSFYLP